ncbi:YncE family protein [Catellatospora coxensis]
MLDVTTGKVAEHWIDRTKYECSSCSFVFTRDGKEVAMPLADRSQGEAAELVRSLQLFDARTGKPTRSLPVKAMPQSPFAWSPDGSRVVARPDQIKEEDMQLIDTATGEAKPFPYTAVWATADELLAKFDDGVLTLRPDGTVIADASLATRCAARSCSDPRGLTVVTERLPTHTETGCFGLPGRGRCDPMERSTR